MHVTEEDLDGHKVGASQLAEHVRTTHGSLVPAGGG